jgi:prepilin-type processing-associated H-X9-DG protein
LAPAPGLASVLRLTSNAGVLMSSWFLSSAFVTSGTAVGALQGIPYPPRHYGGTNVLFCDGHVQWLNHSVLLNDRAELYGTSGL